MKAKFNCEAQCKSACQNQPFFKNHRGKDYCVLHYPDTDKIEPFRIALKEKLSSNNFDFRGVYFPEPAVFNGINFGVAADFSRAKFCEIALFDNASFSEIANFSGASFSAKAYFSGTKFGADAYFSGATFSADAAFDNTSFGTAAYFNSSSFSGTAVFNSAKFSGIADFSSVSFAANTDFNYAHVLADADFSGTSFIASAYFGGASFSADCDFRRASFQADAIFNSANFKNYVRFSSSNKSKTLGGKSRLDLQFAQFEKPERVSFHTLTLHPHWFINVDSRKFEFVDVGWDYRLKAELEAASKAKVSAPNRLLAIAFRQLADNAEANHRYHEASRFRFNAFEMRRIEAVPWLRDWWNGLVSSFKPWRRGWWQERFHGFPRLDWWYWLASGYGESVGRAFLVFVALLALFTLGYKGSEFVPSAPTAAPPATVVANTAAPTAPDLPPKRLGWREAALYSFNVSILQKPEPKPKGLWPSFLVALETVLGPAQAALLALAVRRRFMR